MVAYDFYKVKGEHTSLSNQAFHESLKSRDTQWGIRDLADVIREAKTQGLMHTQSIQMPTNNQSIIFKQT